jgi:opacity protein-like surface antigen
VKKLTLLAVAALFTSSWALAQAGWYKKFEVGLYAGPAFSSAKAASIYSDTWSDNLLESVHESSNIGTEPRVGPFFNTDWTYYFSPFFGLRLSAGSITQSVPNTTDFDFRWKWTIDPKHYEERRLWTGTGRLTNIPLGLSLLIKTAGPRIEVFASAGVSAVFAAFRTDAAIGFGDTLTEEVYQAPNWISTQHVDAFPIKIQIRKTSWTWVGANFGLGLTYKLSESLGLKAEGQYVSLGNQDRRKELFWGFVTGRYDGILGEIRNYEFGKDAVDYIQERKLLTSLLIDPSFIRLSLGAVFRFGDAVY